jgi:hypothetical protein
MSQENSKYLKREIKDFINAAQGIMSKTDGNFENDDLSSFAEKIWSLNHFSNQLLKEKDLDESLTYNAHLIKNLTESPIRADDSKSETCSLITAADQLKKHNEFSKIKSIMSNLISDQMASEVLLDDLMVIYKELAA